MAPGRGHMLCALGFAFASLSLVGSTNGAFFGNVGFQAKQKVFYAGLASLTNFQQAKASPRPPNPPRPPRPPKSWRYANRRPPNAQAKKMRAELSNKERPNLVSMDALREEIMQNAKTRNDQLSVSAVFKDAVSDLGSPFQATPGAAPVTQNMTLNRNPNNHTDLNQPGPDAWAARYSSGLGQYNVSNDFYPAPSPQICTGADYVITIMNRVIVLWSVAAVSSTRGKRLSNLVPFNQFLNLGPYLTTPGAAPGDSVLHGTCVYDKMAQRFYMSFQWLAGSGPSPFDKFGQTRRGALNFGSGLIVAASSSYDPRLPWRLYFIPTTNDGTNSTNDSAAPLLGMNPPFYNDMPRIGADKNGAYVSSTEYSYKNDLVAYNIFALGKSYLEETADFNGMRVAFAASEVSSAFNNIAPVKQPGDAAQPWDDRFNGTTYFACSTTRSSVVVLALKRTATLNTESPALEGGIVEVQTPTYKLVNKGGIFMAGPIKMGTIPLGQYLNKQTARIQSNADGTVLSSVSAATQYGWRGGSTKYTHSSVWVVFNIGLDTRAVIAMAQVTPRLNANGDLSAGLYSYRIINMPSQSLLYPAVAFNKNGWGVMVTSVVGIFWPSAVFCKISDKARVGNNFYMVGGGGDPLDNSDGYTGNGIAKFGMLQSVDIDYIGNAWGIVEYVEGANQFKNTSATPFDQQGNWANWGTRIFHAVFNATNGL